MYDHYKHKSICENEQERNTFVVEGLKRRPRGTGERRAGCDVVYSRLFAFSYTRAHTATLATLHYTHGLTDWHMDATSKQSTSDHSDRLVQLKLTINNMDNSL